ncbi:RNA binding methyltransferase FtsJ like [Lentilactobacillus farraginis DSM 18382 = JCM 14108]|nr:RNA binding methyltransferase FtsJ like [Lentilactobacillus farraginis DSM 18382 = JCM 14108]
MEHTNFRYSKLADFTQGQPQFASIDVSFISLELILPPLKTILVPNGQVVALIKPQFEAGKQNVGKHGIVHDPAVHRMVLEKILNFALTAGYSVENLDFSPIKGGAGNIEFLVALRSVDKPAMNPDISIEKVIENAYSELKRS